MKLGILFSGGKDSCLALSYAKKYHKIACLISLISENKESYMFHTPINLVDYQAKAVGILLIKQKTKGREEAELKDLKIAIKKAKNKYKIKGIVSGAVLSTYQASRIQKICNDLDLYCFNPLWQKDQIELLNELIKNRFEVIITRIAAEGFNESFLGRKIDNKALQELITLSKNYKINIAFEGGEAESLVTYAPFFKKKIIIIKSKKILENYYTGYLNIKKIKLI